MKFINTVTRLICGILLCSMMMGSIGCNRQQTIEEQVTGTWRTTDKNSSGKLVTNILVFEPDGTGEVKTGAFDIQFKWMKVSDTQIKLETEFLGGGQGEPTTVTVNGDTMVWDNMSLERVPEGTKP